MPHSNLEVTGGNYERNNNRKHVRSCCELIVIETEIGDRFSDPVCWTRLKFLLDVCTWMK
jgi:hypothetical protein